MFSVHEVPLSVHPTQRRAFTALAAFLAIEEYPEHSRTLILHRVAAEGTLGGLVDAGLLEPADEALAEQIWVEALEPVRQCDNRWDDPGVWIDVESYEEALERALADTELEMPLPVCGGAPDDDWPRAWTPEEKAEAIREIGEYIRTHQD